MAEGVQFQLERQLEELEQMVHCGLFTKPETSAIIKKRKQCEYKVHRHSKSKEDYLQYIQYESSVLALLRKRREREGYTFRKKEIDHSILNRIHSLFKAALKRFQDDVSLWLTYIQFCKEKKNHSMISRTFSDLLAIHNQDPSLWIMAAQWELEDNKDAETARSLLQRGLRFLGESVILWKEYLRMELINVETMRKRMQVLTRESGAHDVDFSSDPVLSGKIIQVIYRQAVAENMGNVDLLFAFLEVAKVFRDVLPDLEAWIFADLETHFPDEPKTWDALARRHLSDESGFSLQTVVPGGDEDTDLERRRRSDVEMRESRCFHKFEEGLKVLKANRSMWQLTIRCATECLDNGGGERSLTGIRLKRATELLKRAGAENLLDESLYLEWIRILRNFEADDVTEDVASTLESGIANFPTSLKMWEIRLQMTINTAAFGETEKVRHVLDASVAKVHQKEVWCLWETYLDWLGQTTTSPDQQDVIDAFKSACVTSGREASKHAKEAFIKFVAEMSTTKMMEIYDWLKTHRPHSLDYYRFVISCLSKEGTKLDIPKQNQIRRVYQDAISELGSGSVDLWLEWEAYEISVGRVEAGNIYNRAVKTLESKLVLEYETKHTLKRTGHLV